MTRRIGLFGGSFNPPHVAHQMVCLWALSTQQVDEVWLIPCFEHAFAKRLAAFEHRLAMCELAAAVLPRDRVKVSDVEARVGGTSRTIVTVERLVEEHPEAHFALLMGADLLAETGSWYRFEDLRQMVELVVVGRPGFASAGQGGEAQGVSLAELSSSDVRRRVAAGEDVSALLPASVRAYIESHGLYQD